MRKVILRMNEQQKYEIIKELVDHNGNKKRTALKLRLSIRQINRLIKIYKEKGKSGFVHGNRSKKPVNAHDKTFSDNIILLYETKYQGFNFNHFLDYLNDEEGYNVSYAYIYNLLTSEGIYSPKMNRKTRRRIAKESLEKEKKLKGKTKEEIEVIVNYEVALEDSHPRGEKPKYFGEVIEMDGSIHLWFGKTKCCLHLAVDKATNTVVGAYFDVQETLYGYYKVFEQILIKYGIPLKFKTDNRTVFNYNSLKKENQTSDKDVLTQFGYACKQFGVEIETTSVSQAKGLVERDNGTFQGRLVNELKLNGITTIDKANEYLKKVFVPKFNKKFAMDYKKFESVFEDKPTKEKINYTLAILTPRKFDNGNAIKYYNNYYQAYDNGHLVCIKPKTEGLVIKALNNDLLITVGDKIYELRKLERNAKVSKEFDNIEIIKPKKRKKYIPPMNHPWRLTMFINHSERAHAYNIFT